MHDSRLQNLEGWPDLETATSVVRCIKQSYSVASNQGGTTVWDCHIAQFPWDEDLNFRAWNRTTGGNRIINNPTGSFNVGGLGIYGLAAGSNFDVSGGRIATLTMDPAYTQGSGRLIGMGFEVVNTTSQLAVQGTTTVYRQNQSHPLETAMISQSTPGVNDPSFTAHVVVPPPNSVATAMLLPGSRQWHAKDGAYIVQSFVGQDNPPLMVGYTAPVVFDSGDDVVGGFGTNISNVYAPAPGISALNPIINVATKINPIHMGGCILSGLSPSTTLTVNRVYYYETFPNPSEASILVLGTPSCGYDPIALEFFSHCLARMSVGVPSGDNAGGDWFDGLMSILRDVAPLVTPVLTAFNPLLGAASAGIGAVADHYLAPPGNTNRPIRGNKKIKRTQKEIIPVIQMQKPSSSAGAGRGRGKSKKRIDRDRKELIAREILKL